MRRLGDNAKREITQDLYGLGSDQTAIIGAAHIIAEAIDELTGAVVALSEQLERARDVAAPVFETKAPDEIKKAV